jgi:hypothetical protein
MYVLIVTKDSIGGKTKEFVKIMLYVIKKHMKNGPKKENKSVQIVLAVSMVANIAVLLMSVKNVKKATTILKHKLNVRRC